MVQKQIVLQVVTLSHREEAKLWFLKPCLSTQRLSQQLSLFNAGLGNKGPRASKPFSHLRKWNNGSKIRVNENIIQYLQNVNMSIAKTDIHKILLTQYNQQIWFSHYTRTTELHKNHGQMWRRNWQPTPVFLPGEFYGQRSLIGCCL